MDRARSRFTNLLSNGWNRNASEELEVGEDRPSERNLLDGVSQELAPLLDASEKLRNDGCEATVQYPTIVIVGDQSDGKSTVLQAISGVRFPRGDELCTRCPIQLKLRRGEDKVELKYNRRGQQVLKEIRPENFEHEVRRAQDEVVSLQSNFPISNDVIEVCIQTPGGSNLTMTDLPGINRTEEDIESMTEQIITNYIKCDQTIIVVVFKAATDIASVKGFQLAKKFDQTGFRTIGVVSFCDHQSDQVCKNVVDLVKGRRRPDGIVVKEFYPICCHQGNEDSQLEEEFFSEHPIFNCLEQDHRGTNALVKMLEKLVFEKLKPWKKQIIGQVQIKHQESQQIVDTLKDGQPTEDESYHAKASEFIDKLKSEIRESLTGTRRHEKNLLYSECRTTYDNFAQQVTGIHKKWLTGLKAKIEEEYRGQRGREHSIATNIFPVVERFNREVVKEVEANALALVDENAEVILRQVSDLIACVLSVYPGLRDCVVEVVHPMVKKRAKEAGRRVKDLLEVESTIVYSKNQQYEELIGDGWMSKMGDRQFVMQTMRCPGDSHSPEACATSESEEPVRAELDYDQERLRVLSTAYVAIMINRVTDTVITTLCMHLNHALANDVHKIYSDVMKKDVRSLMEDQQSIQRLKEAEGETEDWRRLLDRLMRACRSE